MEEAVNMHVPALQRSLADIVDEYDRKRAGLAGAIKTFERAGVDLQMAATVEGVYGDMTIDVGSVHLRDLELCLLKSTWKHVYAGLDIDRIASAEDKRRWKMAIEKPPEMTLDNIRGTFGHYLKDPRGNILRGLAEVFCSLDQAYKSHDKVKIGVAGLPKRVVLSGFGSFSSHGKDKVKSILNALASYQGKPLVTYRELDALTSSETALLKAGHLPPRRYETEIESTPGRGVRLRTFKNGNGHLFFEPDTLKDINLALAEYYGAVLPDTTDEKPTKKQASTAVSKDLQYYPTPKAVVDSVMDKISYQIQGKRVLEPSCGCGRFMDALRKAKAKPYGIEVDALRASATRARGHSVLTVNFLNTTPTADFDEVVMNPPFYGQHYAKHVLHAFKFLKPGGRLTAILPVTAQEHGLLDDLGQKRTYENRWNDLPVGSFSESGTNINTTILTVWKPE